MKLLRSLLYLPGNKEAKMVSLASKIHANLTKASEDVEYSVPDLIMLDIEDGVGLEEKDKARENISRHLREGGVFEEYRRVLGKNIGVRINRYADRNFYNQADVDLIRGLKGQIDFICLPKLENEKCLLEFMDNQVKDDVKLIGMTESPMGLLNMKRVLEVAAERNFQLDGMIFGSDDYCAELGIVRSRENTEIEFARQLFLTTCKAFGKLAIDMVEININDTEKVLSDSRKSSMQGFDGRQCIHPFQISSINQGYSPTREQLDYARLVHSACADRLKQSLHVKSEVDLDAFKVDDLMIDKPTILQSRRILERNQLIERAGHPTTHGGG